MLSAWCGEHRFERVVSDREPVVVILDADGRECCTYCQEPVNDFGFCNYCA